MDDLKVKCLKWISCYHMSNYIQKDFTINCQDHKQSQNPRYTWLSSLILLVFVI